MRLKVSHTTSYHYDAPVPYALQQLRLRPKSRPNQMVLNWDIEIDGGRRQVSFEDEHANIVDLISFDYGAQDIIVHCEGEVDVLNTNGVTGKHTGFIPLWIFENTTSLTAHGPKLRDFLADFDAPQDTLEMLHALSSHVLGRVPYSTDQTSSNLTSEQVLGAGHGVCQDHAHVFIAAARALGIPARYVSGYLMLHDYIDQDASHAWAEAHVPGLGWIGFDISNGISPDEHYIKVATGRDYREAAPVSGMRFGAGSEKLLVKLQVQQQ